METDDPQVSLQVGRKPNGVILSATLNVPTWYIRIRKLNDTSRFAFSYENEEFRYALLKEEDLKKYPFPLKIRMIKGKKQPKLTIPLPLARQLDLKQGTICIFTDKTKKDELTLIYTPMKPIQIKPKEKEAVAT